MKLKIKREWWGVSGWLPLFLAALLFPGVVSSTRAASGIRGQTVIQKYEMWANPRGVFPGPSEIVVPVTVNGVVYLPVRPGRTNLSATPWTLPASVTGVKSSVKLFSAASGRLIRTVQTDRSGRFRTMLSPGWFRVQPSGLMTGAVRTPDGVVYTHNKVAPVQMVQVVRNQFTDVLLVYWDRSAGPVTPLPPRLPPRIPPLPQPGILLPPMITNEPPAVVNNTIPVRPQGGIRIPPLPPTPLNPDPVLNVNESYPLPPYPGFIPRRLQPPSE